MALPFYSFTARTNFGCFQFSCRSLGCCCCSLEGKQSEKWKVKEEKRENSLWFSAAISILLLAAHREVKDSKAGIFMSETFWAIRGARKENGWQSLAQTVISHGQLLSSFFLLDDLDWWFNVKSLRVHGAELDLDVFFFFFANCTNSHTCWRCFQRKINQLKIPKFSDRFFSELRA